MTTLHFAKPALLRGCAITALLAGASFTAQSAQAQAFQATPQVVQGTVSIDNTVPNETRVTVVGTDAVVDWFPEFDDVTGQGFTFLPEGNTGIFQGQGNFAILNRVMPDQLNSPTLFNGLVQSFLTDANGGVIGPGGFVAFYSPSGIIVGPTGRFEVPQLMLTSQSVDLASFENFANGVGPLFLNGNTGTIDIQAGATFAGTPEDSFMIVASPDINMAGNAYYNGSIAYVASTAVQMAHSSGLFDIVIFGGAAGGDTIIHTGTSGGPSSTGAGDEHVIYGVTAGAIGGGGVSMLFSGNLGFDPAAAANVVNGDIILSANYNVAGRTVDGSDNRQGADSNFNGRSFTPGVRGDIFLDGVSASSNLLAISSHQTSLGVFSANVNFAADVTLVGREQATVNADDGGSIIIGGDLFVSARNFGEVTQSALNIDAVGGFASVHAGAGSIDVAGRTHVTADAVAGFDFITNAIGAGTGGQAQIFAEGGLITLAGDTTVSATARTDQAGIFPIYGMQTGGLAEFVTDFDGTLSTAGSLTLDTTAQASRLQFPAAGPADAFGGDIRIGTGLFGGNIQVLGIVLALANAYAGASNLTSGTGNTAQGGTITVDVLGGGDVQFLGPNIQGFRGVGIYANGFGGAVSGGGEGGTGIGGTISWTVDQSSLTIADEAELFADGLSGFGTNSGLAQGGSVSFDVVNGSTAEIFDFSLAARGISEATAIGTGGTGVGGLASVTVRNSVLNANSISASAGGNGGFGIDGGIGLPGTASLIIDGGDVTAQFGIFFGNFGGGGGALGNGSGGFGLGGDVTASLINGATLTATDVTGGLLLITQGGGGSAVDGAAGDGVSGNLLFEVASGSTANLGRLRIENYGIGSISTNGAGGDGTTASNVISITGNSAVTVSGDSNIVNLALSGSGTSGGTATAGDTSLFVGAGSQFSTGTLNLISSSIAGNGTAGDGGTAAGGTLTIDLQGRFAVANSATLAAIGDGGSGSGGNGGNGFGGSIQFDNIGGNYDAGAATITLDASGTGGYALTSGFSGGNGFGGSANIATQAGALTDVGSLQIIANGLGGNSVDLLGGLGRGGQVGFTVSSSAGALLVADDVSLNADGTGGDSALGTGGDGEGGSATGSVLDLAVLNIGAGTSTFSASATGGSGDIGGSANGGGSVSGGRVDLTVDSGAVFGGTLELLAKADGGDGTSTGGTAQGGSAMLDANAANLSLTGDISLDLTAIGGSGVTGGAGRGGSGLIQLVDTGTDIGGDLNIVVAAGGGFDSSGTGIGGNASGGDATLRINGGTFSAPNAFGTIGADAIAGESAGPGVGGDAFGGTSLVEITGGAVVDLGLGLSIVAPAVSGGSSGGNGGAAFGGTNQFTVDGGSDVSVGSLTFENAVVGNSGTTGGDALGGTNSLAITSSVFNSTSLTMFAGAVSNGDTATITGGNAEITLSDGALASFGDTYLEAYVEAFGTSATTSAGSINVAIQAVGSPSFATFGATEFFNDALGGITNNAGRFEVVAADGGLDFTSLLISNLGDVANPDSSAIIANSGAITFADFLTAATTGDLLLSYGNGGTIIGGPAPDDLTATFAITASGTISLDGDDGAVRSIAALDSTYTSSDIAVGANTAFGGASVTLISSNTSAQAVLGGSAAGAGYTLLQAEADAIRADMLSIQLPDVLGADIDAVVNDLAFVGSDNSGFSRIDLLVDGTIDIIGALALTSAGSGDVLAISAAQQVQVTLPTGSIRLDNNGAPAGTLQIDASRIVAADAALIAEIASDPTSQTVADALLDDGGSTTASNFIFADRVELTASELVLTQNTGANGVYGGITVGAGGLLITQSQGAQGLLQVIAFGLRDIGGVQTVNDDWFALVEFATNRAATYTAEATFNNCNILAGCPVPPEVEPIDPEVPNHTLIEHPLDFPEIGDENGTIDFQFGFDFPRLLDSALISEDELIDEPVTSGGDSAVHALVGTSTGESEEGED